VTQARIIVVAMVMMAWVGVLAVFVAAAAAGVPDTPGFQIANATNFQLISVLILFFFAREEHSLTFS
jgi:hypothetical protein